MRQSACVIAALQLFAAVAVAARQVAVGAAAGQSARKFITFADEISIVSQHKLPLGSVGGLAQIVAEADGLTLDGVVVHTLGVAFAGGEIVANVAALLHLTALLVGPGVGAAAA